MAIGQLNLEAILRNFMPEETSENIIYFGTILLRLIIITIIFLVVKYIIESFFDANPAGRISIRGKQSPQRIKTINTLLRNFSMYILYFLFIYYLLTALGFPVGTLLAGAGIAGVAIGLGAQDLINDMINGFFIIFENHFEVGDFVQIPAEEITGTIEDVGIRTTTIQAASGDKFYIPNSLITTVNNKSRSTRQVTIEIPVADETEFKTFEAEMEDITQMIYEKYNEVMRDEPSIVGFVRGVDQTFNYRIAFTVATGEDYMHTSIFYREYLFALQEQDFKIPSSVYDET
ncbi:MAG: mechanosensitive ion channel family protein [Ruoffia tabacinasalis]|uniref:mechanosensitive ion channel family protein n=1 Tax=Ruoffia sp. FAM 26255 TaxID=3259519 RepID=UPI003889E3DE